MKRAHLWPLALTLVLGLTVAGNLWVMRIANADASFAIEPDYYRKAVAWDSTLAQERRNRAFGWQVTSTVEHFSSARGGTLRVRVGGPDGMVIHDADVRVVAFAVARSARFIESAVPMQGNAYVAELPIHQPGIWELRLDIRKGDAHVTATQRVSVGDDATVPAASGKT